ncbi:MAG TPA: ABC transporter ATP-binding protein [Geminicoccaceae bacterium]|nr:ABC transporter ATP-binding protein [Geminicoccaceae bacterium]
MRAVDDVSLDVYDGEFFSMLGPSGSGKTTCLRLIAGFEHPTSGQILLHGKDVAKLPPYERDVNTVFQDYALFPHMTVGQNVGYGLMVRGLAKAAIRARVAEALGVVALDGFGERYPNQLSGGQRQRVALARALICEPKLILLDEPLGALDAELRRQMQEFLKSLQRRVRISFLFVTHDQEEAIAMSDRICVMNQGMIEQIGAPDEIYYRPRTRFVATFFGDNNLLPGSRCGAAIATPFGPLLSADPRLGELAEAAPVTIAVRPEALRLEPIGRSPHRGPDLNRLAVEVRSVDFIGPSSRVRVISQSAPDRPLLVKVTSRMGGIALQPGDRAELVWAAEDCAAIPGVTESEPS